jgi:hypothetical protein
LRSTVELGGFEKDDEEISWIECSKDAVKSGTILAFSGALGAGHCDRSVGACMVDVVRSRYSLDGLCFLFWILFFPCSAWCCFVIIPWLLWFYLLFCMWGEVLRREESKVDFGLPKDKGWRSLSASVHSIPFPYNRRGRSDT